MRTMHGAHNARKGTDPLRFARQTLAAGRSIAVATVASTWGSAPVPAGGILAVAGLDDFEGSVSGGCIENEVIVRALDVVAGGLPQRLRFSVDDATAWGAGLPCGGEITIFVEAFAPDVAEDVALIDQMVAAIEQRRTLTVATDVASGRRRVLGADGDLGGDAFAVLDGCEVFVRRILPKPRIVIAGGVHIAQVLTRLSFETGYDCLVVDPREAYASPRRFPDCRIVVGWPDAVFDELGLDAASAVVALSHVPEIDDAALMAACSCGCFYIGALGSRRNHERRRERLTRRGLREADFARISGPAGLDIGAQGPAEIALAILGEIVLAHRGAKRRVSPGADHCVAGGS